MALVGCHWFGGEKDNDRVIKPSWELPPEQRDPPPMLLESLAPTSATSSATASQPAGTTSEQAPPYRVIGEPEIIAAAMLQVNDKFITLQQVLHPIREELAAAGAAMGEEAFRRRALALIQAEAQRQVGNMLVHAEAKRRLDEQELQVVEARVEFVLRRAITKMGGSKTALAEQLKREGTTLKDWVAGRRRGQTVNVYLERKLDPQISVSRKMMWEYYQGNLDEFRHKPRVRMQIIAAPFREFASTSRPVRVSKADARLAAKAHIDKAVKALAGGKAFPDVAKKFSKGPMAFQGGLWPLMEQGSFRDEEVEKAAFAQKPGEVSGVIETAEGFHIVRTVKRLPGELTAFEQVQKQIQEKLHTQQYNKLSSEYMAQFQKKAVLQAADKFEAAAADAAVRRHLRR